MQMEETVNGSSISPSGRVQDIRRQWALHEDEALATRLQDEEIVQHYAGNRTRNAIVREDVPRAREEQRREEQEALEHRLRHLSLLQRQAEEDARVAQELAKRYQEGCPDATLRVLKGGASSGNVARRVDEDMKQQKASTCTSKELRDLSCMPSTSQASLRSLGATSTGFLDDDIPEDYDEEDLKIAQERRDAELAKKVQEEMENYERDRLLAIEAQDRELAKLLHEKEKARLKRAKERARQKAEAAAAAAAASAETPNGQETLVNKRQGNSPSEDIHPHPIEEMTMPPPLIPQKLPSTSSGGGFLGFRAAPKALPQSPTPPHSPSHHQPFVLRPHPSSPGTSSSSSSARSSSHRDFGNDPIPPYMPLNGFQRATPPPKRPPK